MYSELQAGEAANNIVVKSGASVLSHCGRPSPRRRFMIMQAGGVRIGLGDGPCAALVLNGEPCG